MSFSTRLGKQYLVEWQRALSEDDRGGIVNLMNSVIQRETTIGFVQPLSKEKGIEITTDLALAVEKKGKHVLLVKKDSEIVGMVILTPSSLPNCKHLAELTRGIINPTHRGRGILANAIVAIIKKCDEIGVSRLNLDVRTLSPAHALWRKVGFEPFGVLEDYVRIDGKMLSGTYLTASVDQLRSKFT